MSPILTDADLAELRAIEDDQMVDTLTFRRVTGRTAQDPGTWREAPVTEDLFTTPGLVAGPGGEGDPQVRTVVIGGVERPVIRSGIKIPISAPALPDGAVVEAVVAELGPNSDPTLAGKVYRLVGFAGKSWATARRFDVVEV